MNINEIRADRELVNAIDWNMTPEEAVRLYLEWGNNWAGGSYVIRSRDDVSYYFVINTWKDEPVIYLVRRNSDEAVDLAKIQLPPDLEAHCRKAYGDHKGVWALDETLKNWLKKELNAG